MTTLDASWTSSLRVVGDLERPDHHYLRAEDECYFMGSYTSRGGFGCSFTNGLISNLKKPMSTRGTPQWKYKVRAIQQAGAALRTNMNPKAISQSAFIPVPPSSPRGTPDYDDRILQVATCIAPAGDVRELLLTNAQRTPRHTSNGRRDPEDLKQTIQVDAALTTVRPAQVILLDDVLTTGCSFVVCKEIIHSIWPGIKVYGVFIARVARPAVDFDFEEWED